MMRKGIPLGDFRHLAEQSLETKGKSVLGLELLARVLLDRLHGSDCECPIHRPEFYPEHDEGGEA